MIISQLDSLPTLPTVAARLLQLTASSETSAKQIVQIIQTDQSTTAKILSLVRRASLGLGGAAVTVEKAVVLMGFDTVRNAVLSMKVFETFGPKGPAESSAFNRLEFWKHSLAVACAAHLLAEKCSEPIDPEEVFVCGLLHDLGKVALDTCLPKSFERVVQLTDKSRACIADVERQVLGIDHTVIGRRLGERWSLPESVIHCMWLHHQGPEALPKTISCPRHIQLVYLADLIARRQRIGYSGNWLVQGNPIEIAERLGIDRARYDKVLEELPEALEKRATIIGLEDLSGKGVYVRAIAEANEELARLNTSLQSANRKLQSRSKYFQALCHLTQAISPRAAMSQVCIAVTQALRTALGTESMLVFARQTDEGYLELALQGAAGDPAVEIYSPQDAALIGGSMEDATVEAAVGGAWMMPAAPQVQELLDRYGGQLGEGPYWLLPFVRERRWVGGAVFSASAEWIAARRNEGQEQEAMSAAIGLFITSVQTQQAADRLSEDLAEVGRRLQQMQEQLLQSRSLSMIAEMAAGAAHELNNPLAIINGRAQLLCAKTGDPEAKRVLGLISEQAHRCSEIVSELMDFAKPHPPRIEGVSLINLVHKIRASWMTKSWLREPSFILELSNGASNVRCDPSQIEQVLEELISNAVDAMDPKDGRLCIKGHAEVSDDRVVLMVEDNGRGMDAEVLRKAFDPFFSNRPAGRKRGLGLARAYRLAEANGGHLRLESGPGTGTIAFLELPTGPSGIIEATDSTSSPILNNQFA